MMIRLIPEQSYLLADREVLLIDLTPDVILQFQESRTHLGLLIPGIGDVDVHNVLDAAGAGAARAATDAGTAGDAGTGCATTRGAAARPLRGMRSPPHLRRRPYRERLRSPGHRTAPDSRPPGRTERRGAGATAAAATVGAAATDGEATPLRFRPRRNRRNRRPGPESRRQASA